MSEINFASFNCRGLGDFKKRKDVFAYLRNKNVNIYFLQDIHCREVGIPYFRNAWGSNVLVAPYANNARGVAILTKNVHIAFSDTTIDENGNFIITKARVEDSKDICLVNIYGPNTDDPNFYNNLSKVIEKLVEEDDVPIIVAGDFNLTLNQKMDNFNYRRENNTRAREAVRNMMSKHELIDIYRERNPEGRRYTWRVASPMIKQARLDMFLVSSSLEGYVEKTDIDPGYRSDHSIITLALDISKQPRGRGLFKFNVSLLTDKDYVALVKEVIKNTAFEYALPIYRYEYVMENVSKVEMTIGPSLFFEVLMMKIRRETVSFGIRKKKEERKKEIQLESEIKVVEKKLDDIGSSQLNNSLQLKKRELEHIREIRLMGNLVRSRARWRENTEKPTKYF